MKIWLSVDREDDTPCMHTYKPSEGKGFYLSNEGGREIYRNCTDLTIVKIKSEGRETSAGWILELSSHE